MKKTLLLSSLVILAACGNDPYGAHNPCSHHELSENEDGHNPATDTVEVISNYDLSTVEAKDRQEFMENLANIEKKHGEQWDFCTCVVKNDSINKAFMKELSDSEFNRLSERFDVIDTHCKAFLTQSSTATPEERAKHEKKVKKCLKEAGLK